VAVAGLDVHHRLDVHHVPQGVDRAAQFLLNRQWA